jgi:uncharacterized membrane protein YGL010W
MEMLTGYAAAHQHPLNIAVHMVGIPTIMLGVVIPLSWVTLLPFDGVALTLAHLVIFGLCLFYATLDVPFALVFAALAAVLASVAGRLAPVPSASGAVVAAVLFLGGYAAQFAGHAVERSVPVVVRRPLQANLAAPFFTVVELCKLLGLRTALFEEVQRQLARRRLHEPSAAAR